MTIPRGINQLEFLNRAKEKSISVRSIYEGVSVSKMHGGKRYCWRAYAYVNGKQIYAGVFPLTEKGEYEAHLAVEKTKRIKNKLNQIT